MTSGLKNLKVIVTTLTGRTEVVQGRGLKSCSTSHILFRKINELFHF